MIPSTQGLSQVMLLYTLHFYKCGTTAVVERGLTAAVFLVHLARLSRALIELAQRYYPVFH